MAAAAGPVADGAARAGTTSGLAGAVVPRRGVLAPGEPGELRVDTAGSEAVVYRIGAPVESVSLSVPGAVLCDGMSGVVGGGAGGGRVGVYSAATGSDAAAALDAYAQILRAIGADAATAGVHLQYGVDYVASTGAIHLVVSDTGQSLCSAAAGTRLAPRTFSTVFAGLLEGLQAMHVAGWAHGAVGLDTGCIVFRADGSAGGSLAGLHRARRIAGGDGKERAVDADCRGLLAAMAHCLLPPGCRPADPAALLQPAPLFRLADERGLVGPSRPFAAALTELGAVHAGALTTFGIAERLRVAYDAYVAARPA